MNELETLREQLAQRKALLSPEQQKFRARLSATIGMFCAQYDLSPQAQDSAIQDIALSSRLALAEAYAKFPAVEGN